MKRSISLVALVALAVGTTGCAHKQLTNQQVAKYAVTGGTVIVLTGLWLFAAKEGQPVQQNALPPGAQQ